MSLRDKILAAADIPSETVEVPEWNATLLIKGMTAADRLSLMQNAVDPNSGNVDMSIVYPDVVVACAYDPDNGERVFSDDDKALIMGKASAAVEKVASVGLRLSGIGKEDADALGKDSSSTESDDSSSS
jgi:hypothetical protein